MSENKQRILLWWSLALIAVYGFSLVFLLDQFPPPSPNWSDARIAEFYADNDTKIRIGATVASWTGGFLAPFFIVMGIQAARLERGKPVWGIVIGLIGTMTTVFLVLPPIFFGVAAFATDRSPDVTAMMHQLGALTLVSTDQYFIFPWVAVVAVCFMRTTAHASPFPRWFGYFSAWAALMFEAGAVCFIPKDGPFAWDGLLPFWIPFTVFGTWMSIAYVLLFKALKAQADEARRLGLPEAPSGNGWGGITPDTPNTPATPVEADA